MKGNFPFKFWCHKVLPLVYDDSISYYEFLCKVAKLVNDISEHNVQQDEAISNNNAYIVKLDNEVHNDIVPHLENEISGLERTLNADIRNLAMRIGFTPYSSEEEYHEGEYCLYLNETADYEETLRYGIPYVCTRDTSGEFDETAWNGTSVSGELNKNYSEISELGYKFIALLGSLAPNYNENETYIENDIVVYNDKVWICKNTATGEWDSDKWELNVLKVIMDKALNAENEAESALEKCDTLTTDYQNLRNDVTELDNRVENAENEAESALEKCDTLTTDYQNLSSTVSSVSQSLNGLDTKVFYGFNSIAGNYQEYSGTPLFYPKDSYVWYSDILYKANTDVTVDSESVLPPDQNSSWDTVKLTDEIGSGESAELNDMFDAFGVPIDRVGFSTNVPKYTIGYTENSANGKQLYYANKDTMAGAGYDPNDWTLLSSVGLYGWVKLITNDISRYSEVTTTNITATIEEA